ncbi:hypothetical protein EMIT0P43_20150 [Pseudomonas jessenii]
MAQSSELTISRHFATAHGTENVLIFITSIWRLIKWDHFFAHLKIRLRVSADLFYVVL